MNTANDSLRVALPDFFRLADKAIALLQQAHSRRRFHGCVNATTLDLHRQGVAANASAWLDARPAQQQLAYMSPEQSGRMSRSVDYRSDYYSLGAVFYELLSGHLPFTATDALELVHCHIALSPAPLPTPPIPQALSDIVLKLLSKNAEDRYQSLGGLSADLAYCQRTLQSTGRIAPFELGNHDLAEHFQLPQKLYGRDEESQRLRNAFTRVAGGRTELFLVSGYSGIGKSSLVNSVQHAIVAAHGIYLSGKFDRSKRNIPYVTVAQAFQSLISQILGGSESEVMRWKTAIQQAAGINGQLLIDLIPELEFLIGKQAPVAELAPSEAANRFLSVFRQFVGVFASQAHPLVLFLDDLQWLDAGSRTLLEHLLTHSAVKHVLVIAAYRDNALQPSTALTQAVDAIKASGGIVHQLQLQPLTEAEMGQWLADLLHGETAGSQALAHLVHAKSAGNPFFAVQFLTSLHEEGLLRFNLQTRTWDGDTAQIAARGSTDNVVDLMLKKLQRLAPATRTTLAHLAILGNSAPIATLAQVLDASVEASELALQEALRASLIVRLGDSVRFAHDRVQEACYSLIAAPQLAAMHLHIGRVLLAQKLDSDSDINIFDLVHHLNHGIRLLDNAGERQQLYQLNIAAGKKARASVAYGAAHGYFCHAIDLLPQRAWEDDYEQSFALYLECAKCASVLGKFGEAETLLDVIISHARSIQDRARVARVRIHMFYVATRGTEGLNFGLETLALFGVHFPQSDALFEQTLSATRAELRQLLQQQPVADLIDLPVASDDDAAIVIGLIAEMLTTAHSARPMLVLPMLLQALKLSLQHGNVEESCVIYSNIGLQMVTVFDDIETGFECSQMALRLNERFHDVKLRGRLLFIHAYIFQPTRQLLSSCAPLLEQGFVACREVGNIGFAGANIDALIWTTWEAGTPLAEVLLRAQPYKDFSRQNNSFAANCVISMLEILIAKLQGVPPENDEEALVAAISKSGWSYSLGHYRIAQQALHCTFGRYEQALAAAELAATMPSTLHALASMVTHHFYYALTLTALSPQADPETRQAYSITLNQCLHKLKQWADSCPQNYFNRYALVAAEIARLDGDDSRAATLYEQAILSARDNGFVQNEALAHELVAAFYRARGLVTTADAHVRSARDCYLRWGAQAKVAQLDQQYPSVARETKLSAGAPRQHADDAPNLDALTVVRASQAVSGEIVQGNLVKSLLKTVIENAGAERGLLLLPEDDQYRSVAEAITQDGEIVVHLRQNKMATSDLPLSVFQYVVRTGKMVLLDEAATSPVYADDPYVRQSGMKSILCLALLKQSKLVGVLYLENRLTTGVFTPERIAVLELLASQAVISLENARLFTELKLENAERKRAEEQLQLAAMVYQHSSEAMLVNDRHNNIIAINPAFTELTGYSAAEIIGQNPRILSSGRHDPTFHHAMWQALNERGQWRGEYWNRRKDGEIFAASVIINAILNPDGSVHRYLALYSDITQKKESEALIWKQANFDTLTRLPNRSKFRDTLKRSMKKCQRSDNSLALLFIDLDRFKEVNDTLGHDKGDILLIEAARRIRDCVRESDTVARLGGDEFTVLLSDLENIHGVQNVAENIIKALAAPFQLGADQAYISGSIGITLYPHDTTELEDLFKHADQALYVAKDAGRNRFSYFTSSLQTAALERMRLTKDLRVALEEKQFRLYFQPIIDMNSGRVHKAEALIRWQHPQRKLVNPAEFIPLAESSGLIMEIGAWVFHEAIRCASRWRKLYASDFQISINQSPLEFQRQGNRYTEWIDCLRDQSLAGQAIAVEITEGLLLDVSEDVTAKLLKLRDAGIQVALDDFGTGYSSLSYLKKFDIDYLKIDQSFTRNLAPGTNDMALSEAIIMMAHKLGLKVIAEGVETAQQRDLLLAAGCDFGQGFLFAQPMPADEFENFLQAENPAR